MSGRKRLLVATWAGLVAAGGLGAATLQAMGAPDTASAPAEAPQVLPAAQSPASQGPASVSAGGTVTVHGTAPAMPAPSSDAARTGAASFAQSGNISAGPLQGPLGAGGTGASCCPCAPVHHVVHHVRRRVVRHPTVVAALPPPPPLVPYRPVYVYRPLVAYRPVVPLVPYYRPVYPVVVARPYFHRAWW